MLPNLRVEGGTNCVPHRGAVRTVVHTLSCVISHVGLETRAAPSLFSAAQISGAHQADNRCQQHQNWPITTIASGQPVPASYEINPRFFLKNLSSSDFNDTWQRLRRSSEVQSTLNISPPFWSRTDIPLPSTLISRNEQPNWSSHQKCIIACVRIPASRICFYSVLSRYPAIYV